MNFADSKQNNLTKRCVVRAFKVDLNPPSTLQKLVNSSPNFVKGKIVISSPSKHIKIRDITKGKDNTYIYFSIYNPAEKVSISPKITTSTDLIDVENFDNVHIFLCIKGNSICAIFQISMNWPEVKLHKTFEQFGIKITPSVVIKKSMIKKIQDEKFKSLHVEMNVHETDFNKKPSFFDSILKNEPKLKKAGITGHLEINHDGNVALATSIENNPGKWVKDLSNDFYIETRKGTKITGDNLKLTKDYFTVPYGSKTIPSKYAKEIIEHFISNEL